MLRYLKHNEIDLIRWDSCINAAPNGLIYALSWYLNIVSPGWHAIVKETNGEYEAVMPLPIAKKFGLPLLKQPILTQQLGIFYKEPLSAADWAQVAEIIKQHFRAVSRYTFNTGNQEVLNSGLPGFTSQSYATYHLDLGLGYQSIFSGYKKNRKWRVNQAKKQNLKIRSVQDISLLFQLFETNTAAKIYGFIGEGFTYKVVEQLYSKVKETSTGEIYEVINAQQEVIAMAFFTFFNQKIIYLFSTTNQAGKIAGAIPFLLDAIIEKYAGSNYTFDFEAPRPDGPGAKTIIDFYESFGPKKVEFLSISLDNLPAPIKWLKQIRMKLYRRFLK